MPGKSLCIAVICLGLFFVSPPGVSRAHHTNMHRGNVGALVLFLAVDSQQPETLYAGSFGHGIFKSNDGGKLWVAINRGLENLYVRALALVS